MFENDLNELFDDDLAEDVTINGQPCRILPGEETTGPSEYDGIIRHNRQITIRRASLPTIMPTQSIVVDGISWKVDTLTSGGPILDVYLSRRAT